MTLPRDEGGAKRPGAATDPDATDEYGLRRGFQGLRDLVDRLLAPDGCPWDREQTLETLRPYVIEEAYEVVEAMGDAEDHRDELGDLLFQIVFQAALQERAGAFDLDEVIDSIRRKLVRRHPHVFGGAGYAAGSQLDPETISRNWQRIKAQERAEKGAASPADALSAVPRGLPPLQRARRLQDAAAKLGFDWPDSAGPLAKVEEECAELRAAVASGDRRSIQEEFGDLLFVLVRLAQKLELDPDGALSDANAKFSARFDHVLRRCAAEGIDPAAATLGVLDGFWSEAKALER